MCGLFYDAINSQTVWRVMVERFILGSIWEIHGCGSIELLSWCLLEGTEGNHETLCQDSDVAAEIRIGRVPNTSLQRYHYACPPRVEPCKLSTEHTNSISSSLVVFVDYILFIPNLL
jgi:hypothetical protein